MLHSNESPPDVPRFPAPWSLRGHAWMVALRLPAGDPARTAFVPADLRATVKSAFSVLMCVVYDEAPCGPYRELLFIPGTMDFGDARHPSISRILVSTWDSVVNGRSNWGIPKDRADFDWTRSDTGDHWRVTSDGRELCSLEFTEPTGVRLPLRYSLGPAQTRYPRAAAGRPDLLLPARSHGQPATVPAAPVALRPGTVPGPVACNRAHGGAHRRLQDGFSGSAPIETGRVTSV